MALEQNLLDLERQFWNGDADFYRDHLDEECITAFGEEAAVQTREAIAEQVKGDAPQWRDLEIEERAFIQPSEDVAILTYRASGKRAATGELYEALVSSGYVNRGGDWRMTFHQQTPLNGPPH